MRKTFSLLIIAIAGGALFYYLGEYILLPYSEDGVLNIRDVTIMMLLLAFEITMIIAFFHALVDKIVFRKFYQAERIILALRRGVLVAIAVVGTIYLRLFGFATVENILLFLAAILLIELLVMNISRFLYNDPAQLKDTKEESVDKST